MRCVGMCRILRVMSSMASLSRYSATLSATLQDTRVCWTDATRGKYADIALWSFNLIGGLQLFRGTYLIVRVGKALLTYHTITLYHIPVDHNSTAVKMSYLALEYLHIAVPVWYLQGGFS